MHCDGVSGKLQRRAEIDLAVDVQTFLSKYRELLTAISASLSEVASPARIQTLYRAAKIWCAIRFLSLSFFFLTEQDKLAVE